MNERFVRGVTAPRCREVETDRRFDPHAGSHNRASRRRRVMNWIMSFGLMAGLALGASPATSAGETPEGGTLKVVVHINFSESGVQEAGLKNVMNILKQAPDARVEVVCHGAGVGLVEKARTDHAEAVEALVKKGVEFVACENTMRRKSIRKEDLLPGVGTVPSGAFEVVRKQQVDGYAYFKP